MVVEDIGYLIFVEFLKMAEYPGAPFTANIIRDLIQFLFIPTVFIILLIYMILGRLFSLQMGAQLKLRVLVGVAIYLFILTSGYYKIFAYLAGPYFIFLIFIIGLFYFVFGHFGIRGGGGGAAAPGHYPESGVGLMNKAHLRKRLQELDAEINTVKIRLDSAKEKNSRDAETWANKLIALEEEKSIVRKTLYPHEKYM